MSQTDVQSNNASNATNQIQITLGSNVTVGNLIVVPISIETAQASPEVTSMSDGLGNTYHDSGLFINDATNNIGGTLWWALVTTGGACTITINFSHSLTHRVIAHEYSNTAGWAAAPLDVGKTNSGASGTPPDSTNFTSTGSDDLLYCFEFDKGGGTHAAGSGWTLGNTTGTRYRDEFQLDKASGTYDGSWASNATGAWIAIAASFLTTSGSGPTTGELAAAAAGGLLETMMVTQMFPTFISDDMGDAGMRVLIDPTVSSATYDEDARYQLPYPPWWASNQDPNDNAVKITLDKGVIVGWDEDARNQIPQPDWNAQKVDYDFRREQLIVAPPAWDNDSDQQIPRPPTEANKVEYDDHTLRIFLPPTVADAPDQTPQAPLGFSQIDDEKAPSDVVVVGPPPATNPSDTSLLDSENVLNSLRKI